MHRKSGFALGGIGSFGLGVALATFVAGFDVQGATMPAGRGIDPATVDRTLKGDRLSYPGNAERHRQLEPPLPKGCVTAADWHKHIYTAEIAGRCIA